MVRIAFYHRDYGLPVHISPRFVPAKFLSLGVPYRRRSFMTNTIIKSALGVEQSLRHGVKVELDAVGATEHSKQAGLNESIPQAKQEPEECVGLEPTPSKKRTQTRRQRNKDSISVNKQEKDTRRASKKVKLEEVEPVRKALTVTRGGSQPWKCPQELLPEEGSSWGKFRIGTSGYVYKHWKSVVYEEGVAQKHWFEMYTRLFDTVEINNTFYRLPAPEVFEGWRNQAPLGFMYALKFSRYLTQMKRLKDPEGPISLFLERANRLGKSLLGPILVQLPPRFDLNLERLECFLKLAPREYRWAIEFRDSRWLVDDVYALLRAYNASLVIHDHEDIPSLHPKVVTADWIYLRFHGRNYTERYSLDALRKQAEWIELQRKAGRDVFVYFNNDMSGHAVFNALELREFVLGSADALKS